MVEDRAINEVLRWYGIDRERKVGHRRILIGRLKSRITEPMPWTESAHVCSVYGNEIDVKGDQGRRGGSQKDGPNVRAPSMRRTRTSNFIAWRKRCSQNLQLFSPFFLFHLLLLSSFSFFLRAFARLIFPLAGAKRGSFSFRPTGD